MVEAPAAVSPPMTQTRPSTTAEATSWRAVGAAVRACQAGGAGGGAGAAAGADVDGGTLVGATVAGEVLGPARGDGSPLVQATASSSIRQHRAHLRMVDNGTAGGL